MSAAGPGRLSRSASKIVVKPAKGYHLMRIDGYSQTQTLLPGHKLSSQTFNVGGHSWRIHYYPNGRDASAEPNSAAAISVYLELAHNTEGPQRAQYKFSLLDKDGIAAYELPANTATFHMPDGLAAAAEVDQGGYDEFIGKQELEKRRADFIADDSIMIRCDVAATQVEASFLAQDDIHDHNYLASQHGFGYRDRRHGRQQHRRADDNAYVQWCLNQPAGDSPEGEEEDYY